MKVFAFTLALAGVTAASLNAQIVARPGTVPSRSTQQGSDCGYNRTNNSVGDIIFGRTNFNTNCRDVYSRQDGAWYQVGNGRSPVYERRIRDNNGNLVIQRARRNPNGSFTILNSRVANNNDKEWRKAEKRREKEYKKAQKRNGNYGDDRDEDDRGYSSSSYQYDQYGKRVYTASRVPNDNNKYSERKDRGRGKGKKDRD